MYRVLSYLFFLCVTDPLSEEYTGYPNKRVTSNVIKTVMTSSRVRCVMICSMTDGCLAVNIIGNHDITCELTTGLSNETEMEYAHNSQVLVLGKKFITFTVPDL